MPLGTDALSSTLGSSTIVGVALEDSAELDDEGFPRTMAMDVVAFAAFGFAFGGTGFETARTFGLGFKIGGFGKSCETFDDTFGGVDGAAVKSTAFALVRDSPETAALGSLETVAPALDSPEIVTLRENTCLPPVAFGKMKLCDPLEVTAEEDAIGSGAVDDAEAEDPRSLGGGRSGSGGLRQGGTALGSIGSPVPCSNSSSPDGGG